MSNINQHNNILKNSTIVEDVIDFKKIIKEIYYYKWIILIASISTFIIAFLYTFTIFPEYKTTALIQVNSQSENNILGSLGLKNNKTSATETELALIRTRYILEPVIKEKGLNIILSPNYFPIFGHWKSMHYTGSGVAKPFLGLFRYSWGGESLNIKRFIVPDDYQGNRFKLIATTNGNYQLFNNEGALVLIGKSGVVAKSSDYPGILLEVDNLKANPGMEFFISYLSPTSMVQSLASNMQVKRMGGESAGGDFVQDTGIIQLQLLGAEPKQIEHILNSIVDYTVVKNIQQKSREAQKSLTFIQQRLPELKISLEKSENTLNQYHARTATLSMNQVNQALSQELGNLNRTLENFRTQREELLQIYTPRHPLVISIEHQIMELERKIEQVKLRIIKQPAATQTEINLMRDVTIKSRMYEGLLNDMHRLELIKAGLVGDIISLDNATPSVRVPSKKSLIMLLGFFVGFFLSLIIIIIKSALTKTIEDFNQLEDELQIPVRTVIPFSRKQQKLEKMAEKGFVSPNEYSPLPLVLAAQNQDDASIESLKSLRISMNLISRITTHRATALMGSLSGIGKSFVSLNFSQVLAESGKKTLLIDADVRKGRLHKALFQPKSNGLCEYLEGNMEYEEITRPIHKNLFFIPCGNYTRHPLELFQTNYLNELIQKAKMEFDEIIIDCPPILPVIDSVLIAKFCDVKLFVVGASSDSLSNVKQAIRKASSHGIEITGIVFNHRRPSFKYGSSAYSNYAYGASSG